MRIIRSSEHRIIPWRNGRGMTREVVQAMSDNVESFDWRISIATVETSGPFSSFPSIDRTIAVLSGDGFLLRGPGQGTHLTVQSSPFSFSGDAAFDAVVPGGASTDLNVMTRRGAFRHAMRRLPEGKSSIHARQGEITLVLGSGAIIVEGLQAEYELGSLDALLLGPSDETSIVTPAPGSAAFCITIHKV
jgi:uncharacterized protein